MEFLIALACIAIILRYIGELLAAAFILTIIGLGLGAVGLVIWALVALLN